MTTSRSIIKIQTEEISRKKVIINCYFSELCSVSCSSVAQIIIYFTHPDEKHMIPGIVV